MNESMIENEASGLTKKKNFLPVLSGLFIGVLVLSNILAVKMIQIGIDGSIRLSGHAEDYLDGLYCIDLYGL